MTGGHTLRKRQRKDNYGKTVIEEEYVKPTSGISKVEQDQPKKRQATKHTNFGHQGKEKGSVSIRNHDGMGGVENEDGTRTIVSAKRAGNRGKGKKATGEQASVSRTVQPRVRGKGKTKAGPRHPMINLKDGNKISIAHAIFLCDVIEERIHEWEVQHEGKGEREWTEVDLGEKKKPGKEGDNFVPVGAIDWISVAEDMLARHGLLWSPRHCQGVWKYLSYADMDAVTGGFTSLNNGRAGWSQELLEDSDVDDMDVDPTELRMKDVGKAPKKGQKAKRKRCLPTVEDLETCLPAHPGPVLLSGSVNENDDLKGTSKGQDSTKGTTIPLSVLASLPPPPPPRPTASVESTQRAPFLTQLRAVSGGEVWNSNGCSSSKGSSGSALRHPRLKHLTGVGGESSLRHHHHGSSGSG
ncbi:unnamed protein product, partial [Choristocarpus tenellus]